MSFFSVLSGPILTHVFASRPFPGYMARLRARIARLWPMHAFATIALVFYVRQDSVTHDGQGFFDRWIRLAFNLTLTHAAIPFVA